MITLKNKSHNVFWFYNEINQVDIHLNIIKLLKDDYITSIFLIPFLNRHISRHDIIDNSLTCFEYVINKCLKQFLHNAAIFQTLLHFLNCLYIFGEKTNNSTDVLNVLNLIKEAKYLS